MKRQLAATGLALALMGPGTALAALDAQGAAGPRGLPDMPRRDEPVVPSSHFRIGLDARNGFDPSVVMATGAFYEDFRRRLAASGASLVPLSSFETADLAGLHWIVLAHPHAQAYSASEIAAIRAFVATGGRAMVCAEASTGSELFVDNMNALVAPWGVTFSQTPTDGTGHVMSGFTPHPVTAGVASYGIDYQRRIESLAPPAIDLTTGAGSDDALAAVDAAPGQGCVLLVSDQSSFTDAGSGGDYDLGTVDNGLVLDNLVAWFESAACGGIPPCDATAAIAGPAEACEGDVIALDATASSIPTCGGVLEYHWLRDGLEAAPWDVVPTFSETATTSATYRVEIRCDAEPGCEDFAERSVTVEPDVPPPSLDNVLLAWNRPGGILFEWQDLGAFGYRLRRHDAVPFDRAASQEVATVSGAFEHFAPGEQRRPPALLFYLVFAVNCAGTEER